MLSRHALFSLSAAVLLSALCAAEPVTADYVIAPNGNDAGPGCFPEPFATLPRALAAARDLRARTKDKPRAIVIGVSAGTYTLNETWILKPEDSGSAEAPLIIMAYPPDTPVFSGGRVLSGFTVDAAGHWHLTIPDARNGAWAFNELFVSGVRRARTRLPESGYYYIMGELPAEAAGPNKGNVRFQFMPGQLNAAWHNLPDVEILPFHNWTMSRLRVSEIDAAKDRVTLSSKSVGHADWNKLSRGRRFLVENVREALKSPGQWYLDTVNGELEYIPLPGEDPKTAVVVAPKLTRLLDLQGGVGPEQAIHHVQFKGLGFAHCGVALAAQGYWTPQAETPIPGAIYGKDVRDCVFSNCAVSKIGCYALELAAGCKRNTIEGCDFTDLGAGGVKLGETRTYDDAHLEELAEENVVRDCFIAYGGRRYNAAIGVLVLQSARNRIEHNEVFDFYYSGFSVGWTWGYNKSNAVGNEFAYNDVHKIGQGVLSDLGGIYTLGTRPPTTIHHNKFYNIHDYAYGGWGIYYDEGSSQTVSENNLVYDCHSSSFHQHYGKENVVRNNILVNGEEHQLMLTRAEPHLSLTVERNVIVYATGDLLGSNWKTSKFVLDNNLYWNSGQPVLFNKQPFDEWKKSGQDAHSLIADPLFVDAAHYDFSFKPESPIKQIGFVPFDVSTAGTLRKRTRVDDWPRAFPPKEPMPKLPPLPIADGFEDYAVGSLPLLAHAMEEGDKATIRVTNTTAATGKQALKFTDAKGLKHQFNPHIYYAPELDEGTIEGSFSVRVEAGAIVTHDWRTAGNPYHTGPSIQINAKGELHAGGKTLLTVPIGQWVNVKMRAGVGTKADGKWDLIVTLPGKEPQTFTALPCDAKFNALKWWGFSSSADDAVVWYLDDLSVTTRP